MAKPSTKPSRLKGSKVLFGIAIALAVTVALLVFMLLSEVASTTRYYVLNQDVSARTLITTDMLTEVVTSQNSAPPNAYDIADVSTGEVFSLYALNRGDIISQSNAGSLTPIRQGIPDEFVVTSFSVDADRAVAGRVQRGDYVDVIAVSAEPETGDERAKYILRNVLILDVNTDLASVSDEATATGEDATASDSAVARDGIPSLYTVGLSELDAAILAVAANDTLNIVLSPIQEGEIIPEDISVNQADVFGNLTVGNSGDGTDATFGEGVEEDEAVEDDTTAETVGNYSAEFNMTYTSLDGEIIEDTYTGDLMCTVSEDGGRTIVDAVDPDSNFLVTENSDRGVTQVRIPLSDGNIFQAVGLDENSDLSVLDAIENGTVVTTDGTVVTDDIEFHTHNSFGGSCPS